MVSLRRPGQVPPRSPHLVTVRSHDVLPESGLVLSRKLSQAVHQKDIDCVTPDRNHRRKPTNYGINYDEGFVTCRPCRRPPCS